MLRRYHAKTISSCYDDITIYRLHQSSEGESGVSTGGPEDERTKRGNALQKDRRDETKVTIINIVIIGVN